MWQTILAPLFVAAFSVCSALAQPPEPTVGLDAPQWRVFSDKSARILPGGPRPYRTTIVANADDHSNDTIERTTEAGATDEQTRALGLSYPPDMYSLSHLALPFPMDDPLYGLKPDRTEHYGIELGALAPRGERNVLIASLDALLRASSNPFFNFMIERIEQGIDGRSANAAGGPPGGQHQ